MTAPRRFDPLRERCCTCGMHYGDHRARRLVCPTGEGTFSRKLTSEEQAALVESIRAVLGKRPLVVGVRREERERHAHLHHFFGQLPDGNHRRARLPGAL